MGKNNLSGAWGEAIAADYLRKKHFKLIGANYTTRYGEIDLIDVLMLRKYLVNIDPDTGEPGITLGPQ